MYVVSLHTKNRTGRACEAQANPERSVPAGLDSVAVADPADESDNFSYSARPIPGATLARSGKGMSRPHKIIRQDLGSHNSSGIILWS